MKEMPDEKWSWSIVDWHLVIEGSARELGGLRREAVVRWSDD